MHKIIVIGDKFPSSLEEKLKNFSLERISLAKAQDITIPPNCYILTDKKSYKKIFGNEVYNNVIVINDPKDTTQIKETIEEKIISTILLTPPNSQLTTALGFLAAGEEEIAREIFDKLLQESKKDKLIIHRATENGAYLFADHDQVYEEPLGLIKLYRGKEKAKKAKAIVRAYRFLKGNQDFRIPPPLNELNDYKILRLSDGSTIFFSSVVCGPTIYDILPELNEWLEKGSQYQKRFAFMFKKALFNKILYDLAYWQMITKNEEFPWYEEPPWDNEIILYYLEKLEEIPENFMAYTDLEFSEPEIEMWRYAITALDPRSKFVPSTYSLIVDEHTSVWNLDNSLKNMALHLNKINTFFSEIHDRIKKDYILSSNLGYISLEGVINNFITERLSHYDFGYRKALLFEDFWHSVIYHNTNFSENERERLEYKFWLYKLLVSVDDEEIKSATRNYIQEIDKGKIQRRKIRKHIRKYSNIDINNYRFHNLWMNFYRAMRMSDLILTRFTKTMPITFCESELRYMLNEATIPLIKIINNLSDLIPKGRQNMELYNKEIDKDSAEEYLKFMHKIIFSKPRDEITAYLLQLTRTYYLLRFNDKLKNQFSKITSIKPRY